MPQQVINTDQLNVGNVAGQLPTYATGTWTPTFVGLTEVAWVGSRTGRYTKLGRLVMFQVTITTTSGTVAGVGGTSYCDLPIPATQHSNILVSNAITLLGIGIGVLNSTSGRVMVPTWAATADIIVITGTYEG